MWNQKVAKNSSSIYKGVSWRPGDTYVAHIRCDGKKTYLGTYASEKEAAIAYDIAASEMHGEFARLNFPGEVHTPPVKLRRNPRAYRKNRLAIAAPAA